MDMLASALEATLGCPVLNETGLTGQYDVELTREHERRDSLVAAVEKELGLSLVQEKRPVEVFVVRAEKPKG